MGGCRAEPGRVQERPAAVKAEMDKLFLGGVNHALFHGTAYSPEAAPWPGWLFYASTHFGPTNPWHRHLPEINGYLARCQFMLRQGRFAADICHLQPEAAPQGYNGHNPRGYDF